MREGNLGCRSHLVIRYRRNTESGKTLVKVSYKSRVGFGGDWLYMLNEAVHLRSQNTRDLNIILIGLKRDTF